LFFDGEFIDNRVMTEIAKEISNVEDQKRVYLTLLAMHILKEEFEDRKDEWVLVSKKGMDYLKKKMHMKKP